MFMTMVFLGICLIASHFILNLQSDCSISGALESLGKIQKKILSNPYTNMNLQAGPDSMQPIIGIIQEALYSGKPVERILAKLYVILKKSSIFATHKVRLRKFYTYHCIFVMLSVSLGRIILCLISQNIKIPHWTSIADFFFVNSFNNFCCSQSHTL